MAKREKRLSKGILSLGKQIEIHEEKQKSAIAEGKIELADYYGREIKGLIKSKQHKESKLNDEK